MNAALALGQLAGVCLTGVGASVALLYIVVGIYDVGAQCDKLTNDPDGLQADSETEGYEP